MTDLYDQDDEIRPAGAVRGFLFGLPIAAALWVVAWVIWRFA